MIQYYDNKQYFAIARYNYYSGKLEYLGSQRVCSDYYWDNYSFMSKGEYRLNMANHSLQYPTYFRREKDATKNMAILKDACQKEDIARLKGDFRIEPIPKHWVPACGWECSKCNKKKKRKCHNLKYPNQNICGFVMAKLPKSYTIDDKRLDAPCDVCRSTGCMYSQVF